MLKIAALVKRVPDPEAAMKVESGVLDVEEKYQMGIFDEIALEQALRVRDALEGELVALCAQGRKSDETLRKALAMGANAAVRLEIGDAAGDVAAAARALAIAVKRVGASVVFCGRQSGDEEAGYTGPAVAALLGFDCVTGVRSLDFDRQGARGVRDLESGSESFEMKWPAVISAGRGLAEPRIPQVMAVMKAMRAKIEVWTAEEIGFVASGAAPNPSYESVPSTRRVKMIESEPPVAAKELVRMLREEAKVL